MAKATGKQLRNEAGEVVGIAAKNANGEGSIYYVAARNRWIATYVDPDGKRHTVTGMTRTEAAANRDAKLAALAQIATQPPEGPLGQQPTIADLCRYWIEYVCDVRPGTRVAYEAHLAHIRRGLGDVPVEELTVDRVRAFIVEMADQYAPDTVRNVRARLRQVVEEAVTLDLLRSNPVVKVTAPRNRVKRTRGPKRILTPTETHRLIDVCWSHPLGSAVAMLFTMGNRSSEVLGLAWSDIDLDAATATIRRGSTFIGKGKGQTLGPTKTSSTTGVHHLPPTVVEMLRQHRKAQAVQRLEAGPAWQTITYEGDELNMVFTNARGGLVLSQQLYQAVQAVAEMAEVDPVGLGTHAGRRSVVTALYGAGLSIDDVARHVGHSLTRTTAGYVADLGERPEQTAAVAAALLDPAAGGSSR